MRKAQNMLSDEVLEHVSGGVLTADDSQLKALFGILKGAGTLGGKSVTELNGLMSYLDTDDFWENYGSGIATDREKDIPELKNKLKGFWGTL